MNILPPRFARGVVSAALIVLLIVVLLPAWSLPARGADEPGWVTAGANAQRTSWTPEEVGPPLRPVWYRVIEPYISMNVQVIAAEGKLFLATARGDCFYIHNLISTLEAPAAKEQTE